MIDYSQFPGLDGVYLEDSYVLAITEAPTQLTFKLLAVLTPDHPAYHDPLPGEHYCYANGDLVFANTSKFDWVKRSNNRYVDAEGEEDLGNIDVLAFDGGALLVEGDWGEVRIYSAEQPRFEIARSSR
jgi:hypothetical protein